MLRLFLPLILIPLFSFSSPSTDLFQAIEQGDLSKVRALIDKGVKVNIQNNKGETPLKVAQKKQKIDIAKSLAAAELTQIEWLGGDYFGYSQLILNLLADEDPWFKRYLDYSTLARKRLRSNREQLDLFSLISGGLAIRESLQLESIRPSLNKGNTIPLSTLKGPEIKSHPFAQMLENRQYTVPEIAQAIPEDFYYIHAPSLKKLLNTYEFAMQKLTSLYKRYNAESVDFHVKEKLMTQLALKENKEARIFYDTVVKEIAITGSDPFIRNGSDVTLIFNLKNKAIFKTMLQAYRNFFQEKFKAQSTSLKIEGISANLLSTPNRQVHSYLLEWGDHTMILSNSSGALTKVLRTLDKKEKALADALDFRYMLSVFTKNSGQETTVYLSDAFIRYLVSPELRIKEARRLTEALYLATAEKMSMFYKHIHGQNPKSFQQVIDFLKTKEKDVLSEFQDFKLAPGSFAAISPTYGRLGFLKPNIDTQLSEISPEEVKQYQTFVKTYHDFWKDFFDPIGFRIDFEDHRLSIETHILPLLDLSIYNLFQQSFGGTPIKTNYTEIPGDIFALTLKLHPQTKVILSEFKKELPQIFKFGNLIGDYATISVADALPMIDFDSNALFNDFIFSSRSHINAEYIIFPLLAWSMFHPLRLTFPLKEAVNLADLENTLDDLLKNIPGKYGRYFYNELEWDYYQMAYQGKNVRVLKLKIFHTLAFRFYCLIDNGQVHIASTEDYMKRIIDALNTNKALQVNKKANLLLRFKPASIQLEKDLFTANLIENLKKAHFRNIATLKILKILMPVSTDLQNDSSLHFGLSPVCPLGSAYTFDPVLNEFSNSLFGSFLKPMIQIQEIRQELDKNLFSLKHADVSLEFTPTGILTRLEIQ